MSCFNNATALSVNVFVVLFMGNVCAGYAFYQAL